MSKAEVWVLERQARFYEKLHDCSIDKVLVISPMVDDDALSVARKLGIEAYS